MELEHQIEAILFYKNEPVKISWLITVLNVSETEIHDALDELDAHLRQRGIVLVFHGDEVSLGTHPLVSDLIETLEQEEVSKDLGKAALETLSVVLYRGPIARSEIDYIRGVNSTFMLRNLLVRGLVERNPNPTDKRSYLYEPTRELLGHLGITRKEELPEYSDIQEKILSFTHAEETEQ